MPKFTPDKEWDYYDGPLFGTALDETGAAWVYIVAGSKGRKFLVVPWIEGVTHVRELIKRADKAFLWDFEGDAVEIAVPEPSDFAGEGLLVGDVA